jgi:C4-type Zn-finger protein
VKILKHGDVIRFQCPVCGCEWLAAENECYVQSIWSFNKIVSQEYQCDCPECERERVEGERPGGAHR